MNFMFSLNSSVCALLLALWGMMFAGCASRGERFVREPVRSHPAVGSAEFRQSTGSLLGHGFVGGNRVTTLINGDQIFTAMLEAIRGAKRSVNFETYVFEKGKVPQQFAEALAERARAGVKVNVNLDAHGAGKSEVYHPMMQQAGVELALYHPIRPWTLHRSNNRTHRKLLIVDGRVGFIGGVGIADEWDGNGRPPQWSDCHYRVEGPAVAQLQAAFMDNWLKTKGELLQGAEYFPALPAAGNVASAAFFSSPGQGMHSVDLMYLMAISAAQKSLIIENAYFVPSEQILEALIAASRRGVRVEILLPGEHIDQQAVRRAAHKRFQRLIAGGVTIYEYSPTMIHSKLLVADGMFVSVGSANFDYRSLFLNDEANLNVLDRGFAAEQIRMFERDRARSVRITPEMARRRSVILAPLQVVQAPFESQL